MSSARNNQNVACQVNVKMALFCNEVGDSHTVLQKFGTLIGCHTIAVKAFQQHDSKVTGELVRADSFQMHIDIQILVR